MKSLEQQLVQYARYHRDRRNILTHFFGIPLILQAVVLLLCNPTITLNEWSFTPALIAICITSAYYLRLSLVLGVLMLMILLLMYAVSGWLISTLLPLLPLNQLWFGALLFAFGWVLQFIGHHFEGKKPAFVDDLIGLVIGPLFVLVELLFLLGFFKQLEAQIILEAGDYRN
ncbi:DUF962 domain-containing protein [Pseudoalteromonas fenneropenaei]|uniref:DUF962 domain-containing protein n=1 Tax=Pseudoalteromonas fenneropenaei TaxID=1737459 RepID=A0ABV7CPT9_9GAMM